VRGGTSFEYVVGRNAAGGARAPVSLALYDLQGRQVRALVNTRQAVGRYHVAWDGKDGDGAQLRAGSYYLRLQAGPITQFAKVMVVR